MSDTVWDHFHFRMRPLPKCDAPSLWQFRPISILRASAKLWSRCFINVLARYDTIPNPARIGFKRNHACAEIVTEMRLLKENRSQWGMEARVA